MPEPRIHEIIWETPFPILTGLDHPALLSAVGKCTLVVASDALFQRSFGRGAGAGQALKKKVGAVLFGHLKDILTEMAERAAGPVPWPERLTDIEQRLAIRAYVDFEERGLQLETCRLLSLAHAPNEAQQLRAMGLARPEISEESEGS